MAGLTSPAFENHATIPQRYTCSGAGGPPPLRFPKPPARTRELALLVTDPDADNFVHWSVLGISPRSPGFPGKPPPGVIQTENSFGDRGWGAPCPPEGDEPHRYVFALYALDAGLELKADASANEVHDAIADHAIVRSELEGRFGR